VHDGFDVMREQHAADGTKQCAHHTDNAALHHEDTHNAQRTRAKRAQDGDLGALLCALLQRYRFIRLPSDIYYISTLPVALEPGTVLLVVASSVMICFLATLYPAWRAAQTQPAEALRYE